MPAPILIFLAWCVLAPAVCAIGFAVGRVLPSGGALGPPLAFWTGIAALCGLIAAWHLFLPVDGRVWVLLAPLAALGAKETVAGLRGHPLRLAGLAVFGFWLATQSALPVSCPDGGLYYTQTVRWNSLYAAVPGLGNLHAHLALNNAYHLLVAAFGVGPLSLRGEHVTNGLFLLAVVAACSGSVVRLFHPRRTATAFDALAALLAGPALDAIGMGRLPCPVADTAVQLMGTGLLLAVFQPALTGRPMEARRCAAVAVACAGAIALKQSFVCIAVPAAIFAALHCRRSDRLPWRAAGLAALLVLPWLAHGVILSGYPLFPSAFPLPVSWRMDRARVVDFYQWVYAWARWPGRSFDEVNQGWVAHWLGQEWLDTRAFLLPVIVAAAGALVLAVRRPRARAPAAAAIACAAGLAAWWILAPDTRFAGPLLWAEGGLLWLASFEVRGPARAAMAAAAALIALGAFLPPPPVFVWPRDLPPLQHNRNNPDARLLSGETVDLAGPDGCWDAPCASPPLDPRLRLRKPGDWSSGFTLDPK